jgi:hypothetical protein
MWPFDKTQKEVTGGEFATGLLELMRQGASAFCAELQERAKVKWALAPEEVVVVGNQVFVADLWMVSKVMAQDKQVLDLLHDGYFSGYYNSGETSEDKARLATDAQSELCERYERYYKAWDDDIRTKGGLALAFEMAQFFFPTRRPVLDMFLQASIQGHILAFMASAIAFRKRHEIKRN